MDAEKQEEVTASVGDMRKARYFGIPKEHGERLDNFVLKHQDIFRFLSSDGPQEIKKPLNIYLTTDARPIRVKPRNNSTHQREFLAKHTENLIQCGMAYLNPTSSGTLAPLLVS